MAGSKKLLAASLAAQPPQRDLLDERPADEADVSGREFAEDIGEAIADWLCTKLSDYAREVPEGGDHLAALVEVLVVLHSSMGQMDALPDVRLSQVPFTPSSWLSLLLSLKAPVLCHCYPFWAWKEVMSFCCSHCVMM